MNKWPMRLTKKLRKRNRAYLALVKGKEKHNLKAALLAKQPRWDWGWGWRDA